MHIPRLQLFELEDQAWFPSPLRDFATDYLRFIEHRFALHRHAVPILERALSESGVDRIVDLCSGGGGSILDIVREAHANGRALSAVLTDLYPSLRAFEEAKRNGEGRISYVASPVDARRVPPELSGLRTLFNAFHHFRPDDALAVLRGAAAANQPVAIVEVAERRPRALLAMLLVPLMVWLTTPFIRPRSWPRMLLTYLVPAVPLTCLWDGMVSQLRAYRPDELRGLAERAAPSGYTWEAGTHRANGTPGRITYLVGWPSRPSSSSASRPAARAP